MELKQFISYTLGQIFEAIIDTQQEFYASNIAINPSINEMAGRPIHRVGIISDNFMIQDIEFDILLGKSSDSATEAGIGVFFAPVSIGARGKSGDENHETTRVKFSIPVVYPPSKYLKPPK